MVFEKKEEIKSEPAKNEPIRSSDVNVNEKQDKQSTVKVDFMNASTDDILGKQTKSFKSEDSGKKSMFENVSGDEIRKEIAKDESNDSLSPKDLNMFAEFFIEMYEMALQATCGFIVKGAAPDSVFALTQKKKDVLIKQLTFILVKYQSKLKIEIIFLITLGIASWRPIQDAREIRKQRKKGEENSERQKQEREKMRVVKKDEEGKTETVTVEEKITTEVHTPSEITMPGGSKIKLNKNKKPQGRHTARHYKTVVAPLEESKTIPID